MELWVPLAIGAARAVARPRSRLACRSTCWVPAGSGTVGSGYKTAVSLADGLMPDPGCRTRVGGRRLRRIHWVVHCEAPFAGPEQVLRYLPRYTHRVAISNRRLVAADNTSIAFRWKDYRINGPGRWKTMRLPPHEFIRRFLMHVLPKGFHRIRH